MAAPLFFVPLALAGGKVFFKFATKKAAQAFKGKYAKAGSVTTKAPAKNAEIVTTGSAKGQSIIKDMTKPTTMPRVSPRNPNTTTLPKAPKKGSGAGAATATAATGAGVAGSAKSTGNAESKSKTTAKNPDAALKSARDKQRRAGKLSNKSVRDTSIKITVSTASPTSKPKDVPKRKATASPTSKPKNIPDRKGSNVKLSSGKTVKQRLAEIDKEKAANKRMELRKKLRDQMKKIAQDKKNKEFVKKAFSKGKK